MKGTKVAVAVCRQCRMGLYSISIHDFRDCPCGTFVDGGFQYFRIGWTSDVGKPRKVFLTVPQTKPELYQDYNLNLFKRKYGILNEQQVRELYKKSTKKTLHLLAPKSAGKKTARGS